MLGKCQLLADDEVPAEFKMSDVTTPARGVLLRVGQHQIERSVGAGSSGGDDEIPGGAGLEIEPFIVAAGEQGQLGEHLLGADLAQGSGEQRCVVGRKPIGARRRRGVAQRELLEVDILVAVARIGPDGIGLEPLTCRHTDRIAQRDSQGRCAGVRVKTGVGDTEVGLEGQTAVGADGAEDIE